MSLESFFNPKSVAVIGVSRDPRKFGHIIFKNFIESKFNGKTYPINPKADNILGFKGYTNLKQTPSEIDLAIIAVSASFVPSIIDECLFKNVKAAIIVSGGFGETGKKGKELERKISIKIKDSNLRVIGPNCIGVFNPINHVDTMFLPKDRLKRPKKGPIAFISQSGALGAAMLDWASSQNIGISKFVSIGNKIDVNEIDLLNYLDKDPITKCITVYVEGISNGRKFLKTSKNIIKNKPLIVLKGGVTLEGSKAALSHTGSMAGSAKIYKGAFKQVGIIQVQLVEDLFDYARILAYQPILKGQRDIAVITNGGGFGVISADVISKLGLKLANFKLETLSKLKEKLPDHYIKKNPLDLTGDANIEHYRISLKTVCSDPNVNIILIILLPQTGNFGLKVVNVINRAQKNYGKPIIACTVGGKFAKKLTEKLEGKHIPTYTTPEKSINAINALIKYSIVLEDINKKETYNKQESKHDIY